MKRYLSLSALGVAAVVALTGCGAEAGADHNSADVMFAQMMIPHHQQAVEMSDIVLEKEGVSTEVTELATDIRDAQAPEIETMTGWLEAWGEPVMAERMEGHDMGSGMGGMDGMLSEDQMDDLEAADGEEASKMFLESMIEHHEGAVEMAQEEIDDGENAEAIALAEDIVEAQEAEIQKMEELLGER